MRNIMPIVCFEHLQSANCITSDVGLSAVEICDRIAPVRQRLETTEVETETLLSFEYILGLNDELVSTLENGKRAVFRDPEDWQSFLNELTIEFSLSETSFSETGSYVLSQLFWSHLTSFRLLTAWLIVDQLAKCLEAPRLSISQQGLGLLVSHLSHGGPPIYDLEDMRGRFPDCYQ